MKSIIQRYVGLDQRNCPIWIDTAWGSLLEAHNHYLGQFSFRAITVEAADQAPTFWATLDDVNLRPCCNRHVA
jgi:hypothetical protein